MVLYCLGYSTDEGATSCELLALKYHRGHHRLIGGVGNLQTGGRLSRLAACTPVKQ